MNHRTYIIGLATLLMTGCEEATEAPMEVFIKCDRTEVNAGETVNFMDGSTGGPTRWDWTFEGGEPASSQCFSPEITYNRPGTYNVILRIGRGDNSVEQIFSNFVNVAYPAEIVAEFSADKLNAYNTDEVAFSDLSTGYPNKWSWIFTSSDGNVLKSDEQNPRLKFTPGIYSVTLNVSSPAAEATITKKDYLNIIDKDAVAAEFSATTPIMIIAGECVTFVDKSMGRPERWNWIFEGADITASSEASPTIRYSTPGRYRVSLTASNDVNSSTCEKEDYIMVLPADGLKMWFPFEGSLNDMGPYKNIIMEELSSNPDKWRVNLNAPSRHDGRYAVELGGVNKANSDDYAVLQIVNPSQLPGGLQAMTLVMWIKANGADASRMGLFNRGRPAGAITYDTNDKNQSQEWARLNKTASASEGFVRWHVMTTGQGSASAANTQREDLLDDNWHCLVFVKEMNGGNCVNKIYVDGKLSVAAAAQAAKDTYKDPFLIGCTQQFTKTKDLQINNPLIGCLDDIMIYDYALDADEVGKLYYIMK